MGLLVAPAMAETTVAGYIDYGFTRGMDDPATTKTRSYTRFDLKGKVDDFNSTLLRMESINNGGPAQADHIVKIRIAKITTNLAGVLGLTDSPIGIKTFLGWDAAYDKSYCNLMSRHRYDVGSADVSLGLIMGTEINLMKMANLVFYIGPNEKNDFIAGINTSQKIGGFPLNLEVMFAGERQAELSGADIIIDGEFKPSFGDIKLDTGFGFKMDMVTDGDMGWGYGFGAGVTASPVNVRFNLNGTNAAALDWVMIEANLGKFAKLFTFRTAAYLRLAEGQETFQGMDVCANFSLGKMDLRTGYVMNAEGAGTNHTWAHSSVAGVGNLYIRGRIGF
jgi:hypothetical protein